MTQDHHRDPASHVLEQLGQYYFPTPVADNVCRAALDALKPGAVNPAVSVFAEYDVLNKIRRNRPANDPYSFEALIALVHLATWGVLDGDRTASIFYSVAGAKDGTHLNGLKQSEPLTAEQSAALEIATQEMTASALFKIARMGYARDCTKLALALAYAAPEKSGLAFKALLDGAKSLTAKHDYELFDIAKTVAGEAAPGSVEQIRAAKLLHHCIITVPAISDVDPVIYASMKIHELMSSDNSVLQKIGAEDLEAQRLMDQSPAGIVKQRLAQRCAQLSEPQHRETHAQEIDEWAMLIGGLLQDMALPEIQGREYGKFRRQILETLQDKDAPRNDLKAALLLNYAQVLRDDDSLAADDKFERIKKVLLQWDKVGAEYWQLKNPPPTELDLIMRTTRQEDLGAAFQNFFHISKRAKGTYKKLDVSEVEAFEEGQKKLIASVHPILAAVGASAPETLYRHLKTVADRGGDLSPWAQEEINYMKSPIRQPVSRLLGVFGIEKNANRIAYASDRLRRGLPLPTADETRTVAP